MADGITISFGPVGPAGPGDLVVFVGDDLSLSGAARDVLGSAGADLVARAAASERFKGRSLTALALCATLVMSAQQAPAPAQANPPVA